MITQLKRNLPEKEGVSTVNDAPPVILHGRRLAGGTHPLNEADEFLRHRDLGILANESAVIVEGEFGHDKAHGAISYTAIFPNESPEKIPVFFLKHGLFLVLRARAGARARVTSVSP